MKNLFSLVALSLASISFAQSFTISDKNGVDVTNNTVTITGSASLYFPNDEPLKWQGKVSNETSLTKPVLVKRQVINVPNGSQNQFCWSIQCYAPVANQATDTVDIAGAATDESFYSYFFPGGANGLWTIRYVFFDASNPNDSAHVTLNFDVSGGTSIQNQPTKNTVPFGPIPANEFVLFNTSGLNLQGMESLRIFDLSGKTLMLQPLKKEQEQVQVPLDGVHSGLYLWSIVRGNNSLGNGRLIVQH
ncbi:MAG: hypothetical protein FJZ75_00775 [Bacteroidetes bacterium]|nr:hypothetical protein [Bacteroidota bacterium]